MGDLNFDLKRLQATHKACSDARHSGLVRYLGRIIGNEATVGRGLGLLAWSTGSALCRHRRLSQDVSDNDAAACHYPDGRLGGVMAVCGPGVVTGGKSGIQASGGKGSAKSFPRAVFVRACYGAPRSQCWLWPASRPEGPTSPPRGGPCAAAR